MEAQGGNMQPPPQATDSPGLRAVVESLMQACGSPGCPRKRVCPQLSTYWPCVSLFLSPPLRKSSRIYKNLKKRDKGINRKWLLEVNGG